MVKYPILHYQWLHVFFLHGGKGSKFDLYQEEAEGAQQIFATLKKFKMGHAMAGRMSTTSLTPNSLTSF